MGFVCKLKKIYKFSTTSIRMNDNWQQCPLQTKRFKYLIYVHHGYTITISHRNPATHMHSHGLCLELKKKQNEMEKNHFLCIHLGKIHLPKMKWGRQMHSYFINYLEKYILALLLTVCSA